MTAALRTRRSRGLFCGGSLTGLWLCKLEESPCRGRAECFQFLREGEGRGDGELWIGGAPASPVLELPFPLHR